MKKGIFIGVVVGLLSQGIAVAVPIYTERSAWLDAFEGPYFDVDLGGAPNQLTAGGTLVSGSPIQLPPAFVATLRFDSALGVQAGAGWNNYINPGGGAPLILATPLFSLRGTFSHSLGKFGFELLPTQDSTITLTLSDGSQVSMLVAAQGSPQFFGWIVPPGEDVVGFTIASDHSGLLIGNFVVPDGGATFGLLGIALLILAAGRSRFVGQVS